MEPKIEFAKTRDFGEIISDSFLFVRENFKPLIKCFFTFCGIFLVAGAVVGILQQIKMIEVFGDPEAAPQAGPAVFRRFGVEYVMVLVFSVLNITAIQVTVLSFIALYKEKGNIAPTNEEVWGYFKYYYLKICGSLIINVVIVIVGCIFCLIPGIYFYAVLGLTFPIMIMENTSYSYAFNQSFRLIKNNWWLVFGSLFIISLIVSIASGIAMAPFTVTTFADAFLHPTKGVHMSLPSAIGAVLLGQVCHVLYILPMVTLALCYFSLTESKEGSGLLGRINNQLGNNTTDTNLPAEEY